MCVCACVCVHVCVCVCVHVCACHVEDTCLWVSKNMSYFYNAPLPLTMHPHPTLHPHPTMFPSPLQCTPPTLHCTPTLQCTPPTRQCTPPLYISGSQLKQFYKCICGYIWVPGQLYHLTSVSQDQSPIAGLSQYTHTPHNGNENSTQWEREQYTGGGGNENSTQWE